MSKHCSLRYTLEIFEKELYAIGQSKHEAKKAYGGKTPKIYSYGTLTRYFGIAKEFVDKMYQEGIRRVNQVQVERFMRYLKEKAEETRRKTIKLILSAFRKYLGTSPWRERKDLREVIEKNYYYFLDLASESGEALPFSNPERVIEKLKHLHHKAIATIQLLTGARIDDVPKVVESLMNWRKGQKPILYILKSKGGRNRELNYEDRVGQFYKILEAVTVLLSHRGEKGWMKIKEDYYPDLKRAVASCGETYTGSHAFRVNYAQRRLKELLEKHLSEKEALKLLTLELGHNRISMAKGYAYR